MARVTIEDCLQVIPDRFTLIAKAAHRARCIAEESAVILVDRENDRDTVVALREIAAGYTSFDQNSIFENIDSGESSSIQENVFNSENGSKE